MYFQMIHRSYLLRGSTTPPDGGQRYAQDDFWKNLSELLFDGTLFRDYNGTRKVVVNEQYYIRIRPLISLQECYENFTFLLKSRFRRKRIGNKLKSLITTKFNIGRLAVQSSRSRRKTRVVPVSHFFYFVITSKSKESFNSCANTFPFSASFQ